MNQIRLIIIVLFLIILSSCSGEKKEVSLIKEVNQNLEMTASYKEAYNAPEGTVSLIVEFGDFYNEK